MIDECYMTIDEIDKAVERFERILPARTRKREAVIEALRLCPVRRDKLTTEQQKTFDLAHELGLVQRVRKEGPMPEQPPEPPPPKRITKLARDVRPGDFWPFYDPRGRRHSCHEVTWVGPDGPSFIHIECMGLVGRSLPRNAEVEVWDGPFREREKIEPEVWFEYHRTKAGDFVLEAVAAESNGAPEAESGEQPAEPTAPGMTWQDAAERMERLRTQGERFTSQPKLAEQLGCSSSTINKAIQNTPSLQEWAKRPDAEPKAQSLTPHNKKGNGWTDMVTDNIPQRTELDPFDDVRIREYLEREDLTEQDRATFNALPSPQAQLKYLGQLEETLATLENDPDKDFRIRDRKP